MGRNRARVEWRSLVWVALIVVAAAVGEGQAQDDLSARGSLKGLKAVRVVVEHLDQKIEEAGLHRDQIQTDTELSLRKTGITVTTNAKAAPGFLYLNATCIEAAALPGVYACSIDAEFRQYTALLRDRRIRVFASTWSVDKIWVAGRENLPHVRQQIGDVVDNFTNAYLEQNPKR